MYDYRDPDCGKNINRDTNDSLKLIWDTISVESSNTICAQAFSSDPSCAKYGTILERDDTFSREGIERKFTFMYTIFNDPFMIDGEDIPVVREDFEFAKKFFGITEQLLQEGKLRTHPEKVGPNGLEGALQGMEDMKNDKVSGTKLVYRVEDTPVDSDAAVQL